MVDVDGGNNAVHDRSHVELCRMACDTLAQQVTSFHVSAYRLYAGAGDDNGSQRSGEGLRGNWRFLVGTSE